MALANGHQAIMDTAYGRYKYDKSTGKATLTDLQIHGPEQELAKLREPLKDLNPSYWVLEYGFRN